MNTKKDMALELTGGILRAAKGADCIVTVCPMCQLNLEAYQKPISDSLSSPAYGTGIRSP
jgi:heterodisulfide reductase subunit B